MLKGHTRASSWDNQTDATKRKMITLGSMFKGGIDVTSGWRSKSIGDDAMLGSASDLNKYKGKWKKGLTTAELNSKAGSAERKSGIAKMRANGFQSQHEHGNAIDFSYPHGYSEETFPKLKSDILGVFPGANLIKEKDHLHMSFNDKTMKASSQGLMNFSARMGGEQKLNNFNQLQGQNTTLKTMSTSNTTAPVVIDQSVNNNVNKSENTVLNGTARNESKMGTVSRWIGNVSNFKMGW